MTHKIETSFEELHKILDLRKQKLLGEVNRITEDKIKNLNTQMEKLSIASGEVHGVIDYTEQSVKLCSDDEVMSMHSEVMNKIKAQITERDEQKSDTESSEKADLIVKVDCVEVQTNMKSHIHLQCVGDTILQLVPVTTLYQAVPSPLLHT